VAASLAALGSVIAASSCCLPLLPFLFAAGRQAPRPLSSSCDLTSSFWRCYSLLLVSTSLGGPSNAIASPAGSALFFCGSLRLWCLYSSSFHSDRQPGGRSVGR